MVAQAINANASIVRRIILAVSAAKARLVKQNLALFAKKVLLVRRVFKTEPTQPFLRAELDSAKFE